MLEKIKNIKINSIISIFLIVSPILDLITSIQTRYTSTPISVGAIIRPVLLLVVIIYSGIKLNKRSRRKMFAYVGAVFIYAIAFLTYYYIKDNAQLFNVQLRGILRNFSFPLMFFPLLLLNREEKIRIKNMYFSISLLLYVMAIIIPYILGVSESTYDIGTNKGYIGWFYAGNDISIVIIMLFTITFSNIFETKNMQLLLFQFVIIIASIFTILYIGTKTPFLGMLGLLIAIIIGYLFKFFRDSKYKHIKFSVVLCSLVVAIVVLPYTPVGSNMGQYSIFVGTSNGENEENNKIDVSSGRKQYREQNLQDYMNASILEKILGVGYTRDELYEMDIQDQVAVVSKVNERKLCEMDLWDIIVNNGIVGSTLFFIPLAVYLWMYIVAVFKKGVSNLNIVNVILTYAIILAILISYIAGHTFVSTSVSTIVIFIWIVAQNKIDENMIS